MYNENQHKLADVIGGILKENNIAPNYYEAILKQNWEKWLGKTISSRTKQIKLYGNKLVIEVYSAPLRQELEYAKAQMLELLNKNLKHRFIKQIEIR